MDNASKEFLTDLLGQPSPSGFEQRVRKVVRERMSRYADRVHVDVHGNTWGVRNEEGRPRVMLAGHCDEIGLMVTYINDQGFLAVAAVGGVNVTLLQGQRVRVHARRGDVPGVIAARPIHDIPRDQRSKSETKIENLWLDIGARNRRDAERAVAVGDVATVDVGYTDLRNGLAAARAFDDRIGAFVVCETLRLLQGKDLASAVFAVSTVQEEVGIRGAHTSAYAVNPDVGIAVDVGFATDYPDTNKKKSGDVKLGGGPVLHRGANINPVLEELLEKAARRARIRVQMQASPIATGTDANAMQLARGGKAAALVSIPTRYMHSPSEVLCPRDAEQAARLLARFIQDLKPGQAFVAP